MKTLKLVSKILFGLTFCIYVVSLILGTPTNVAGLSIISVDALILVFFLIGLIGILFTENSVFTKISHGLFLAMVIYTFVVGLKTIGVISGLFTFICGALGIVAYLIFLIYFILSYFLSNGDLSSKVERLKELKELLDENIISSEEFKQLRNDILKLNNSNARARLCKLRISN